MTVSQQVRLLQIIKYTAKVPGTFCPSESVFCNSGSEVRKVPGTSGYLFSWNRLIRTQVEDEINRILPEYMENVLRLLRVFRESVALPSAEESFHPGLARSIGR